MARMETVVGDLYISQIRLSHVNIDSCMANAFVWPVSLGLKLALQTMPYTFWAIRIAREAPMAGYQPYLSKEACSSLVLRKLIDKEANIFTHVRWLSI